MERVDEHGILRCFPECSWIFKPPWNEINAAAKVNCQAEMQRLADALLASAKDGLYFVNMCQFGSIT